MKIASWNINSVRARSEQLLAYLEWARPDVLCLQELKCLDAQFPLTELQMAGYDAVTFGQKSYNGVAILARGRQIENVARGVDDDVEDLQSRLIVGTVSGVRIVSVYAPNGRAVGTDSYVYKLAWFHRLRQYLERHSSSAERLVVCGDFNVAPEDRDVYDPVGWKGSVLVSEPERAALAELRGFGLTDTFRLHHAEAGAYSWWDYRQLSFPKNNGLRIDTVLATAPLAATCDRSGIDRDARKGKNPSDHAPVWASFTD